MKSSLNGMSAIGVLEIDRYAHNKHSVTAKLAFACWQ